MDLNVEVIGISRDMSPSLGRFKEAVNTPNTFLSDLDGVISTRFGAMNPERKIARRYYFLIDEDGVLIWKNVTGQLIPTEKLIEELAQISKSN